MYSTRSINTRPKDLDPTPTLPQHVSRIMYVMYWESRERRSRINITHHTTPPTIHPSIITTITKSRRSGSGRGFVKPDPGSGPEGTRESGRIGRVEPGGTGWCIDWTDWHWIHFWHHRQSLTLTLTRRSFSSFFTHLPFLFAVPVLPRHDSTQLVSSIALLLLHGAKSSVIFEAEHWRSL